jgi:hypothetical protein
MDKEERKVVFIFECHLQETLSHFPASSNPIEAVQDCMPLAVNFHLSTHIHVGHFYTENSISHHLISFL